LSGPIHSSGQFVGGSDHHHLILKGFEDNSYCIMDFSSQTKALVCLRKRLDQDDAPEALKLACQYFLSVQEDNNQEMGHILVFLSSDRWDCLAMGLQLALNVLAKKGQTEDFETSLIQCVEANLEHSEPRVRTFVAQVSARSCLNGLLSSNFRSYSHSISHLTS